MKSSTIFQIYSSLLNAGISRLGKPNPFRNSILVNWMSIDRHRKEEFDNILEYFKLILPNASDIDILKVAYEMQLNQKEIEKEKEKEIELQKQKFNFSCTENYYLKLLSVTTQRYVSLLKLAEI